jgi:arylsulfatase A-like enzyme
MNTAIGKVLVLLITPLAPLATLHAADAPGTKPNILVVLADDLGFSDLGCYGSEIETPNLDRLAGGGVRFTQFYNTAKCHSSRISLLTGRYPYQAGNIALKRSVTLPEVLAGSGYFTAMTGKWHLKKQPTDFGFQRFFGHLSGACSYHLGNETFRLNGQPWTVPPHGFYTTIANVDFGLQFLDEARLEMKPWCLYVAFNAPHAPLQPLEQDYRKYRGRYDAGWDVLRAQRVSNQERLGLFGGTVVPCPRPDHVPAWDSLSAQDRAWESRRMAAYAAVVDRLDQEIGRLLENLRAAGELDNTFILFVSDNGASPYDRRNAGKNLEPCDPRTTWNLSTGWAWVCNTPFRFYKQNQFEGGIATPAIVHWPAGMKAEAGAITDVPAHLIDVLPTLADVGGAAIPTAWPGREPSPLAGVSLGPVLAGGSLPPRPIYFLYDTDRGLREGDWKLVSFQSHPWELYNLAEDRTELHDLSSRRPDVRERLAARWFEMAERVDMAPPRRRTPLLETAEPAFHPEWSTYTPQHEQATRKTRPKKARAMPE